MSGANRDGSPSDRRLLAIVVPAAMLRNPPGARDGMEIALLLVAALAAERYPVRMHGTQGGVSVAAVFIVSTAFIHGWAPACCVGLLTRALVELAQRRPPTRLVYNGATFALSGGAAGAAAALFRPRDTLLGLLGGAGVGTIAFYGMNVVLVAAVIACASRERFRAVLAAAARTTAPAFAIMASVAVIFGGLWLRSPLLTIALGGPLVAVSMYQRSVRDALEAMELALTDPLTGLGNKRSFEEQLQRELVRAEPGRPVSLCLLDLDDFKVINDRFGHPAGDRVLQAVGSCLRHGGEGYRLGGDEFALLLPGLGQAESLAVAKLVVARIGKKDVDARIAIGASAGVATYPSPGVERSELVRAADDALYTAKHAGKNAVRAFGADVIELSKRLAQEDADRRARMRAAASLTALLESRHAPTGDHSYAVGELAGQLATRLGLGRDDVELVRLAGSLHDIGKLAIADDILGKPGPLTEAERALLGCHTGIAYRMLHQLGIEPVATWVLHSHERWDGTGGPSALAGEEIPLGSRIVFAADAWDAMTRESPFRRALTQVEAVAEVQRCAGSQFDPEVVAALVDEVATQPVVAAAC